MSAATPRRPISEDTLLGGRVRLRQPAARLSRRDRSGAARGRGAGRRRRQRARYRLRRRRGDALPRRARRRAAASPASSAQRDLVRLASDNIVLNEFRGPGVGDGRRSAAPAAAARARQLRPCDGQPAFPRGRARRRLRRSGQGRGARSRARPISPPGCASPSPWRGRRARVTFIHRADRLDAAAGAARRPRRRDRRSFRCGPAPASRRSASSCARARAAPRRRGSCRAWCCTRPTGGYTAAAEAVLRHGAALALDRRRSR